MGVIANGRGIHQRLARGAAHDDQVQHVMVQIAQDFFAVAQEDVAPHGGIAGGDACEIAKARSPQRQRISGGILVQDAVHEGKCRQVRQVADGGKGGIVGLRCHGLHLAAQCFP